MSKPQPKETLLDLIKAGDTARLGDFFYTSAAKAKGIVKVRPADIGWEDYTLTADKFESAEADPSDIDEAMRWCVVVDDISECDADTKALMYLERETGDMIIAALSGPSHDHEVAIRMVARDLKGEQRDAPARKVLRETARLADNQNNQKIGKFTVTRFRDLGRAKPKPVVVKGVRYADEISYMVAKPGGGKSVLETDICYHIATGRDWHGHKVEQGLVVYFAAERKALQDRRVMAYRKHYGDERKDVPLVVIGGTPNLTDDRRQDAQEMVKIIKALEVEYSMPCRCITIDTLARTFGGRDQNLGQDMMRYVHNIDLLKETFPSAHTSVIHHEGWETGRAKGGIDFDGAVDASFRITKNSDTYKLICDGANDGVEGDVLSFTMRSVDLGVDEDGEPITAPVVIPAPNIADLVQATETKQAKAEADAMDIFLDLSAGGHSVGGGMWLAKFRETEPEANERTMQSRWHRAVKALEKAGRVSSSGSPKVYALVEMQA